MTATAITDRVREAARQGNPRGRGRASSRRRRCPASARPAASRSSSRTAATSATGRAAKGRSIAVIDAVRRRATRSRTCFCVFRANAPQLYRRPQPRPVPDPGRQPGRRLHHAADLPRLALRQRLQPLRPHLAGGRPGRAASSATTPTRSSCSRCATPAARWCRSAPSLSVREIGGPINIGRYNMYPAAAILGGTKPGVSHRPGHRGDGAALRTRSCRRAWRFEWTEINYMQIDAAKNIWNNLIFPLAVVFVFLVLAAQYESWALPLAVILVVPMCILGSLTGVAVTQRRHQHLHADRLRGAGRPGQQERDPDRRVRQAQARGGRPVAPRGDAGGVQAAAAADPDDLASPSSSAWCRCWSATGPAPRCGGRWASAVFSGMLGVTLFGIFLTPVFFYVIEGFAETPLFSSARARLGRQGAAVRSLGIADAGPALAAGAGVRPSRCGAGRNGAARNASGVADGADGQRRTSMAAARTVTPTRRRDVATATVPRDRPRMRK